MNAFKISDRPVVGINAYFHALRSSTENKGQS